jgi:tetratricopeptide (TPR) repeat protein
VENHGARALGCKRYPFYKGPPSAIGSINIMSKQRSLHSYLRKGLRWRWKMKALPRVLCFPALFAFLFIGVNANAQSLSDVQAILRQAREDAVTIQPPEQRFPILSRIAVAQSRAKDPSGALGTAQQAVSIKLAEKNDPSSLDELEALIAVQVNAGDRNGAARTLDRLLRAASSDKSESAQITLAGVQAKVGDTGAALKAAGRSPLALARVAEIQAQAGDRSAALTTLRLASEAAAATPEPHRSPELAYIASVQFRASDQRSAASNFAEAVRIASGGGQAAVSPMAFMIHLPSLQQIAAAQIQAGDSNGASKTLEAALRFARMHPDDAGRTSNLNSIARAFTEAGNKRRAMQVLREAHAITNKVAGDRQQRSALLLEIAEIEAEAGYVKEAVQTLDHLWNSIWQATSKQIIQEAEAKIARIQDERTRADAKADLGQLIYKLNSVPHWSTGLQVAFALHSDWLLKLAVIQAKVVNQAEAAVTFQQAVKAASIPLFSEIFGPAFVSLQNVALAQATGGDWQAAAGWVSKLTDSEARSLGRLAIARGLLNRIGITSCEFPRMVC